MTHASDDDRRLEVIRMDKQMRLVRWLVIPFTLVQFVLYKAPVGARLPFDRATAAGIVVAAILGINLISLRARRVRSVVVLEWLGRLELAADVLVVLGVVGLFTFDPSSALWALLILPVLEGAIRGRVRGALVTWGACTAGYVVRELVAARAYGFPFAIQSVTYRMGIVLVVAVSTGYLARNLEARIVDHLAARRESEHHARLLKAIASAGRTMSSLDPEEVLKTVVEAGIEIGFEAAAISVIDDGAGTFHVAEHRGLPDDFPLYERPVSQGIVGLVLDRRATAVLEDYPSWPSAREDARSLGFDTVAGSPVWSEGRVTAVLALGKRDKRVITPHEIECLELLAAQAGAALSTAQHYTERRLLQEQLYQESFHDSLTGLPNRALFFDRLQHTTERKGDTSLPMAVLFCDLDGFKKVNDSLGLAAGDEVLRQVTHRMLAYRSAGDTVARYGGDEFAMLIESPESERQVIQLATRIVVDLQTPFAVGERDVYISASVGVSYGRQSEDQSRDLLREADLAMYRAKEQGGAGWQVYRPLMTTRAKRRMELELELRRALDRDELSVHYQPAISASTLAVVGLEALVRWTHPTRGIVPAAEFIPFAESSGLIVPIGQRILDKVGEQLSEWRSSQVIPSQPVGVNLSAREFEQADFVDRAIAVLDRNKLKPTDIIFEVTESVVMRDDQSTLAQMRKLGRLGVRMAIDDFGLGYSSLSYLKRFKFSVLKIDKSFVRDITTVETDQAIVRYVLGLASDLGIPVVAEGVETEDQLEYLRSVGCEYVQGFHLCKPLDARSIVRFITERSVPGGVAANGDQLPTVPDAGPAAAAAAAD